MKEQLIASILKVSDISESQVLEMYSLMGHYYNNVDIFQFKNDLMDKDILIILKDSKDNIQGFSTQKIFPFPFHNKTLRIVFSGDTVIHKNFRGSLELPITWGKFMLDIESQFNEEPLYWMLITKGIRTYRYLPVFFYEFYPNPNTPLPYSISDLRNSLGYFKFGNQYDKLRGIICANAHSQSIKELENDEEFISNRSFDPFIDFFMKTNPNYGLGEELLCITRFTKNNLRPFIVRALQKDRTI